MHWTLQLFLVLLMVGSTIALILILVTPTAERDTRDHFEPAERIEWQIEPSTATTRSFSREPQKERGHAIQSTDGKVLAVGLPERRRVIWGEVHIDLPQQEEFGSSLCMSWDGHRLFVASKYHLYAFQQGSVDPIWSIELDNISQLACSPTGQLVVCIRMGRVHIRTGEGVMMGLSSVQQVKQIAVPTESRIVVMDSKCIQVFVIGDAPVLCQRIEDEIRPMMVAQGQWMAVTGTGDAVLLYSWRGDTRHYVYDKALAAPEGVQKWGHSLRACTQGLLIQADEKGFLYPLVTRLE